MSWREDFKGLINIQLSFHQLLPFSYSHLPTLYKAYDMPLTGCRCLFFFCGSLRSSKQQFAGRTKCWRYRICLSKVLMTFMPLIHKLHMGFSSNKSYSWVYVARTQPYFKNQILFQFKICFHMIWLRNSRHNTCYSCLSSQTLL
jgi:hypothetical protein